MQFHIGEQVVHPLYGLGTIKSITRLKLGGVKALPYYEVVTGGPTIWVPVDKREISSIRAVVPRASLAECRLLLARDPVPLEKNYRLRQVEISTRLQDESFTGRCAMVRDLSAQGWSKPLGEVEDALLKRITNAVCDEWAASKGVTPRAAFREIEGLLDRARLAALPQ